MAASHLLPEPPGCRRMWATQGGRPRLTPRQSSALRAISGCRLTQVSITRPTPGPPSRRSAPSAARLLWGSEWRLQALHTLPSTLWGQWAGCTVSTVPPTKAALGRASTMTPTSMAISLRFRATQDYTDAYTWVLGGGAFSTETSRQPAIPDGPRHQLKGR